MNWTRPAGLRSQLQKLWERGDVLASLVTGEALFPRRLILKVPTSAEMAERFDEVRGWVGELRAMAHCRVEMRDFSHRLFGANAVPNEAWVDTLDDALALIGKRREVNRFMSLVDGTRQRQPSLLDWLARRPLRALELSAEWSRLLDIVAWLQAHPRPGVYLRQVDIAGAVSYTHLDVYKRQNSRRAKRRWQRKRANWAPPRPGARRPRDCGSRRWRLSLIHI